MDAFVKFFSLVVYYPRFYYKDQDFGAGYFSRDSGRNIEFFYAKVSLVCCGLIPPNTLAGLNNRGKCLLNQTICLFDPRGLFPATHGAEKVVGIGRDNLAQFYLREGFYIGFDPQPLSHLGDSLINPVVTYDKGSSSFNRLEIVLDPTEPGFPEHQSLIEIPVTHIVGSGA